MIDPTDRRRRAARRYVTPGTDGRVGAREVEHASVGVVVGVGRILPDLVRDAVRKHATHPHVAAADGSSRRRSIQSTATSKAIQQRHSAPGPVGDLLLRMAVAHALQYATSRLIHCGVVSTAP